jgi:hypothetical protein
MSMRVLRAFGFAGLDLSLRSQESDSLHNTEGIDPYHFGVAATDGNPRQRISLAFAGCAVGRFAAGSHWLRPLSSINAPFL